MSARSDGQKKRWDRDLATRTAEPRPAPVRERAYGTCPACGYVRAVGANGTIGTHHWKRGQGKCAGSGRAPRAEASHG